MPLLNEKERVYQELEVVREELRRTTKKLARVRDEVGQLKAATTAKEAAILRSEATEYRKALSNIAYRLDSGGVSDADLRDIVESALLLRGLKVQQRQKVERLRSDRKAGS